MSFASSRKPLLWRIAATFTRSALPAFFVTAGALPAAVSATILAAGSTLDAEQKGLGGYLQFHSNSFNPRTDP